MKGMKKYVVSSTLESADAWRNSTIIRDNVAEEVRKLKQQPGKNIYLDGSSELIPTLAENNLIDEYSLLVYPVVLGGGKGIFPDNGERINMKLVSTKTFPTGIVHLLYAVENPA
jgi:dihydrofolate reductase